MQRGHGAQFVWPVGLPDRERFPRSAGQVSERSVNNQVEQVIVVSDVVTAAAQILDLL